MRVFLARAKGQGQNLAGELAREGIAVWYWPTIDFCYLGANASPNIGQYVVFPSATGVRFFRQYNDGYQHDLSHRLALCVGPATATAAKEAGFSEILAPTSPPYGSDALFGAMARRQIDREISIVTSPGGRGVIQEQLDAINGQYEALVLYERVVNTQCNDALVRWQPQVVIASSYDVWLGAKAALGASLGNIIVVVPSERVAQLVRKQESIDVRVVSDLSKATLIQQINAL